MKRKKLFLCISSILILMMFSGSMLTRIQATEFYTNTEAQITQIDKSSWFWSSTEVISQTDDDSHGQKIYVDSNNNIHVVFNDDTDNLEGTGTDRDIFYLYWNAETRIWSNLEAVSTESTALASNPDLAVDRNGNVHVAWEDQTDILGAGADRDVFYKRRSSSGSWSAAELVSTDSTGSLQQVSIDVDSLGNPSIVWTDQTDVGDLGGTDYDIFYNNLTVVSSSWLGMTLVSTESDLGSFDPDVKVDENGDIHVVWYDFSNLGSGADRDIFFKKYSTSDKAWTSLSIISTESTDDSEHPYMTIDNTGTIHVVWEDITNYQSAGSDGDIFYKYYSSQFLTWTTTEVISIESSIQAAYGAVVVDLTGTVHIAWEDITPYPGTGADWDIYYKYRDTPSDDWTTLALVSETSDSSYVPDMVVDSLGHIHIVWYDNTDYNGAGTDWDIFYRKYVGSPQKTLLYPITPNPSLPGNVTINWEESFGAQNYNIYRDQSYILSTSSLTPIATVTTNSFVDDLNTSGTYYYSVVASNYISDSDLSNIESIEILSPETQGFFGDFNWGEIIVIAGIVGAIQIILTVTMAVLLRSSSTLTKKKKKK